MILTIYLLLLGLGLIFIILGLWADNPILSIVGAGFLFICGTTMTLDNIEYKTGLTIVESGSTSTVTYNYTAYSNKTMGIIMTMVGFAALFLTLMDMWRARKT